MASVLLQFLAISIGTSMVLVVILKTLQLIRTLQQQLLNARAQAQRWRSLNDDLLETLADTTLELKAQCEYSTCLLKDLEDSRRLNEVSDEELPKFIQRLVARRVWQTVVYGANPVERAKLASKVGGACFRIMDAAKRNPAKIADYAQ